MLKVDNVSLAGGQSSIPSSNQNARSERKENVSKEAVKRQDNVSAPTEKQLIEAVESGNKELKHLETNLRFSIHEKTKQITVKIIDTATDEVIKEIPSEKILDMVAAMMEKAGLLVDKRG
ncbi:flagellar protein FlaG [Acetoanaerobium pronyense]|uniref:Flagellar protein FlaG n=1 Tax=Acetoanaerobium pronyense TaxID=1482736 RepID=A0ABS4KJ13_9FIRM|nr:flagellar protein FlaG [Acetoanaerobium pronyense]MBP2027775.1 flagellar protein FlaG [Acetoanaerobium pronyense]